MDREARKYWQTQRRQMLRRDRQRRGGYGSDGTLVTKILIGLMVLSYLIEVVAPGVAAALTSGPIGIVGRFILSALSPGSILGLIFAGVFLWFIGSQLEVLTTWWQYLLIFFVSGFVGALISSMMGAGLMGGTYASFGLAGAFVMVMANRRVEGMAQWAIILLAINVVLSGFNAALLAGMLGAFFTGLAIARLSRL